MRTYSTAQLRTAIEESGMLDERINDHATHSTTQMPEVQLGDQYIANIETRSVE